MRAEFFLGEKTFETRETEIPELGNHEVLVQVAACGICGTDVHVFHGDKGSAEVTPPVVLGHELSGVVVQVGTGVSSVTAGDHVAVDPNIYCNQCRACRTGKKQACKGLRAIGVTQNGGFAEYCVVPEEQCFFIERDIPLEYAALAEPVACCLHGIDRANISPGSTVCIIGGGAIGLIMLQLAKLSGASKVILSEPVEMRRFVAVELGADSVIDPNAEDVAAQVQKITNSDGADVVIECVGNVFATEQAFSAAGSGSTILLFSVPKPGAFAQLPLEKVYKKELTIRGSIINPDTHQRAVDLINNHRLQLAPLITHAYPLGMLKEAIHMQMQEASIKVILKPDMDKPIFFTAASIASCQ